MNTTINGSEVCSVHWNPTAYKIGATIAYCLIFVVSLVGNSCIGIIVYKTKTLRKPVNIFIVNMAMSDLLVPLFYIPKQVAELYLNFWLKSGVLGNALCKLIPFIYVVSFVVSVQSLVLISVGRFGAVVFPLRSPLISAKRCPLFILASWIFAMATISPNLFSYRLEKRNGEVSCVFNWKEAFGVSVSDADVAFAYYIAFVFIPIILLILLYSVILFNLKLQNFPGKQFPDVEIQRKKRNINVFKLAIAILLGLAFCKLPLTILKLAAFYATLPCGTLLYIKIVRFLFVSYCAINPCICFAFCRNYREGLKKLLKCSSDAS